MYVFTFHLYSSDRVVVHASSRNIVAELKLAGARFRIHLNKTDIEYTIAMKKTEGKMSLDSFMETRSYAALRAADLDWIVGPGYSWGG